MTTNTYPRGSEWRKWDLHVHTPESIVNSYSGPDPWEKFLKDLESLPPEFKVLGINDYLFLDGYRRILQERANGRLSNIDLILPVVEFRLDKFGGSPGHLSKVNFHVIFSDELDPDVIQHQFLNALCPKYSLVPAYHHLKTSGDWSGLITPQSLADLGQKIIDSVPPERHHEYSTPLLEGFNNLCLSLESIQEALRKQYFSKQFVTAVGKTEWAAIKWNEQSIADKKHIINSVDLVFISSESTDLWEKAKKGLTESEVNDRLIDCSDAHSYSDSPEKDRIGKCFTWIKADPTFKGLLQVLNEHESRVYIGTIPPKTDHVQKHSTKYIESISINRKPTATLNEVWFANDIPLNPNLVAIIGNKGKGKSALTDTIGLLCNTKQHEDFTFLSLRNFRNPKSNKAKEFVATLTWNSGAVLTKGLEETIDSTQPELVKYIPQNFLEKICTQIGKIEESDFDRELKKVIFSHVEHADRLGKHSLDELIEYKTSEASSLKEILKQELHRINEEIAANEEKSRPEYRKQLENQLAQKIAELEAHEKLQPQTVAKPENDPVRQQELSDKSTAIENARDRLRECEARITSAQHHKSTLAECIAISDRLLARFDNLERHFQEIIRESAADFDTLEVPLESVVKFSIDKGPILKKREWAIEQGALNDQQLDPGNQLGLFQEKGRVENEIQELQRQLDEPNRQYQSYIAALSEWERGRDLLIGGEELTGTVEYYRRKIAELDLVPAQLAVLRSDRLNKSKEIHAVICTLATNYRQLYDPVHRFIEERPLAREKFQLNFEVGILDVGLEGMFFDVVDRSVSGTYYGKKAFTTLREMIDRHDLNTEEGMEGFLVDIMDSLERDRRTGGTAVEVADQVRNSKSVVDLYDIVFSLDYLKPRYSLRMGEKELHQLSPGERGTILLVFYLLVDKNDIPLVIDQPEENLDNQTVYELLVPCMKEAKERRQIVIVTHNPNLAVVCDAEQVIRADLDKKHNYQMTYDCGAIENPLINKAVLDILEGTRPAFDNRDDKYL